MRREVEWIRDALDAANRIHGYTDAMDLETYRNDRRTQDAVERCFLNITETVVRLRRHAPDLAQRIPNLRGIAGFRNLLVHEYHRIQPERIWDYILDDLPNLQLTLESLLAQAQPDGSPTARAAISSGSKPDEEENWSIIADPFRPPSPFDPD